MTALISARTKKEKQEILSHFDRENAKVWKMKFITFGRIFFPQFYFCSNFNSYHLNHLYIATRV